MDIDNNMISYLEEISKLKFNENEKENLQHELNIVLDYIKKLNEVDTSNVEELVYPFDFSNNFRKDSVYEDFNKDVSKTSNIEKDYFIVPKIFY